MHGEVSAWLGLQVAVAVAQQVQFNRGLALGRLQRHGLQQVGALDGAERAQHHDLERRACLQRLGAGHWRGWEVRCRHVGVRYDAHARAGGKGSHALRGVVAGGKHKARPDQEMPVAMAPVSHGAAADWGRVLR